MSFYHYVLNISKMSKKRFFHSVFGSWIKDEREINSKLLLKIVKTNLFNESSNLIHGVSSKSKVSRSVAVQFSNSKISNLVQLIHNLLDKSLSFSDVISSLNTSKGSEK